MAEGKRIGLDSALLAKVLKQTKVERELREVIYNHAEKWLGRELDRSQPLPKAERNFLANPIGGFPLVGNPIHLLVLAGETRGRTELKTSIVQLREISALLDQLEEKWHSLDFTNRSRLGYGPEADTKTEKIISALGVEDTIFATIALIKKQIALSERSDNDKLAEIESKGNRGRPVNEAAHRVAETLAQLYIDVTGKRPTYSENVDGLHGHYTPALRDVFLAFGWNISLANPAKNAVKKMTERPAVPVKSFGFRSGS